MKTILALTTISLLHFISYSQQFIDATQQLPVSLTTPLTMDAVMIDLDNDQDLDIILACEFKQNIILFNNGMGKFDIDSTRLFPKIRQYLPGHPIQGEDSEDIALADFNQDSIPDLFFVSEDTPYHELFFGNGNGSFYLATQQIPKSIKANAVAVIDPNSDGWPDILIGNEGQNELYMNRGNGIFMLDSTFIFPLNTDHTQDLKVVDIDGDDDLDIVEGNELGGSNIYTYDAGKYTEVTLSQFPNLDQKETRKIVVEDIDQDGDQDLFLCNVLWRNGAVSGSQLLLNDGQGSFVEDTSGRFPYTENYTLDAVFIDINADQLPDLITVGLGDIFQPKVYLNNIDNPGYFYQSNSVLPTIFQDRVLTLLAGDVNGDGLNDLYMGSTPDRLLIQKELITTHVDPLQKADIHSFYNSSNHSIEIHGEIKQACPDCSIYAYQVNGKNLSNKQLSSENKVVIELPAQLRTETIIVAMRNDQGQIVHYNVLVTRNVERRF